MGNFAELGVSQKYGSFFKTLGKSRLWVIFAGFRQIKIIDNLQTLGKSKILTKLL